MVAPKSQYNKDVLSWIQEQVNEGENFLQNQHGYNDIDKGISYIMGDQKQKLKGPNLANYQSNRLAKVTNDIVSALTDMKPIFNYRTHNESYYDQAEVLNRLATSWWLNNFIDLKFGMGIELAIPAGASYLQFIWNPELNYGQGDLDLIPRDCRDVLPIRPTNSFSIQDSLGVIIRSVETIYHLRQKFPNRRDELVADADVAFYQPRQSTFGRAASAVLSPVHRQLKKQGVQSSFRVPGKQVYTCYIHDDSVNESNSVKRIGYGPEGEKYTWSYEVRPGESLYPRGRYIVATNDLVLYDGPNPYWHGLFPIVKVPMDLSFVFPDSFLSKSILADLIPLQDYLNELLDGVMDASRKALRPGIIGDKRFVSESVLKAMNTREAGWKLRGNAVAGEGIKLEEPIPLPSYIMDMIEVITHEIEYQSGSLDLTNLARVRQIPSDATIEAIQQAMTPVTRLRSRILEAVLREAAEMVKFGFLQFYDVRRRVSLLGPGGLTFEDFDFDPGIMTPDEDFMPGEDRVKRAIAHAQEFGFYITPNSLLEMALIPKKVLYLQLRRMGDIDHKSLLEMLEVPNIQKVDERLGSEIDQKIAMMQEMQAGTAGRKPTAQRMPRLEQKGDGRPVISES